MKLNKDLVNTLMQYDDNKMLTVEETSVLLNTSPATVRKLHADFCISGAGRGDNLRFDVGLLVHWVNHRLLKEEIRREKMAARKRYEAGLKREQIFKRA